MNSVSLVGRLTRDVEVQATPNSKVAKFGFAVTNRRKDQAGNWVNEPLFIDCELWGNRVDVLQQYAGEKGTQLALSGSLQLDTWEDKTTGQRRSKIYLRVSDFTLVGSGGEKEEPKKTKVKKEKVAAGATTENESEIPF